MGLARSGLERYIAAMMQVGNLLARHPVRALELIGATLVATLLSFSTALFTMHVLRRYVAFGVDGTLLLLTLGTLVALGLLLWLLAVRSALAQALCSHHALLMEQDMIKAAVSSPVSGQVRPGHGNMVPEVGSAMQTHYAAFEAGNFTAVLDAPCSLLFLAAIAWIHPGLGVLGGIGVIVAAVLGKAAQARAAKTAEKANEAVADMRASISSLASQGDTHKVFGSGPDHEAYMAGTIHRAHEKRINLGRRAAGFEIMTGWASSMTTTALYAGGAVLAVAGEITVAEFIGVSILGARACQIAIRYLQARTKFIAASQTSTGPGFQSFSPSSDGSYGLENYSGEIELRDVALASRPQGKPVLKDLFLRLAPGHCVVVTGPSGSGKAMLTRALAGLLPQEQLIQGKILLQGVDSKEIAREWWRTQVMYMPREPVFFNLSIRDNLRAASMGRPLDDGSLARMLSRVGLDGFVFSSAEGLNGMLHDQGRNLPLGQRKRLALARALATGGPVALFDEPLEGLDHEGRKLVLGIIKELRNAGKTVVVAGNDPELASLANQCVVLQPRKTPHVKGSVENIKATDLAQRMKWTDRKKGGHSSTTLDVQLEPMLGKRLQAWAVMACFLIFCVWSGGSRLAMVSHLHGRVAVSSGVAPIEHLEGGIVAEILVREGEQVEQGQVVLVMKETMAGANVGELGARIRSLEADVARFRAEANPGDARQSDEPLYPEVLQQEEPELVQESLALFRVRTGRLASDLAAQQEVISQSMERIAEVEARLESSRNALALLQQELALSQELLKDQLTTRLDHLRLLGQAAMLEAAIVEDESLLLAVSTEAAQAEKELAAVSRDFRVEALEKLIGTHEELAVLAARMTRYEDSLTRTMLRSPIDGFVQDLFVVNPGEVVEPGETLLRVVPDRDRLVVEARLPVGEIGYVHQGQHALIRLDSPDAGIYEPMAAIVERISPDAVRSPDGPRYYQVRLVTKEQGFSGPDREYTLYPGMVVRVAVVVGERSLLRYLLSPYFLDSIPGNVRNHSEDIS